MTIRQFVRRRVLIAYGLILLGVVVFFAAGTFGDGKVTNDGPFMLLWLIPATAGIIIANFAVRCPRCKGNLGRTAAAMPYTLFRKRRFNFCMYCGVSADEPVDRAKQ